MSWLRIALLVGSVVGAAIVATFWPGTIGGNADADAAIVELYAMLAAVLLAIISIIGDPAMLLPGNWRVGFEHANDIQRQLQRYTHVFALYLVVIGLIVVRKSIGYPTIVPPVHEWLGRAIAFTTVLGFLWSIPLPYRLMAMQRDRLKEAVKRRRDT
ncbi:MAG TPA: hypothetical protein VGV07_17975 [Devosia sp.]|jgi:hypothetical protein|uniref:hypothetical protein n=1 Tax=Devosia sp. TaxID=1871048 RepID=UPI002DDCD983|nr:hypothetical protein [Devosia sp.]HEV2517147.1 hypothetical protein [Devosia sp.]